MADFSEKDEKKLVERAKRSINAFGKLYDLYVNEIYKYILYRVGRVEDAEDLTALTFEKAMRSIESFEWQGFKFSSWLYKIAHNLIVDEYRKKKQYLSVEEIAEFTADEENESVAEEAGKNIDIERLMKEVAKLSDEQREIVYLRYIKELSIQETMDITGKTIDSIKSLAKRAIKILKDNLDKK